VKPEKKAEAWSRVLVSSKSNNPFSGEDDRMRTRARERVGYWRSVKKKQDEAPAVAVLTVPDKRKRPKELSRQGRFIAYNDGTVLDTKTELMWAAKDNGRYINWKNAKEYCETYRGGGYNDWRMPTQDELYSLYNVSTEGYKQDCDSGYSNVKLTRLIHLSCCCSWASETKGSSAAVVGFLYGGRAFLHQSLSDVNRALPVRVSK